MGQKNMMGYLYILYCPGLLLLGRSDIGKKSMPDKNETQNVGRIFRVYNHFEYFCRYGRVSLK
jgi:hypothetical protein